MKKSGIMIPDYQEFTDFSPGWSMFGSQQTSCLKPSGSMPCKLTYVSESSEELYSYIQFVERQFGKSMSSFILQDFIEGCVVSSEFLCSSDWKIAEACSGIRYLTSSIVVGVLVAGVAFRSWKRRLIFVLMSAITPVLANALRAYLIVVLAYVSNNRIATGVDHVVYGWIFFSLVTAVLVGAALRWREPDILPTESSAPSLLSDEKPRIATPLWCAGILIVIAMSAAFTSDLLWSHSPVDYAGVTLWSAPPGWIGVSDPDHDWTPDFASVAFETFRKNSAEVSLYIATSTRNKRGMELVNSSNAVDPSGEWRIFATADTGKRISLGSRSPSLST